ncbi:MAG: HAD family hydrolase [Verrucomicrobiota bacterium]
MLKRSSPAAVLWDMDGTLIDQTAAIIACFTEVIEGLGYKKPEAETIRRSLGGPLQSTLLLFVEEQDVSEATKRFRARFPQIMYDGLIILEGAMETIEAIQIAGIPQAIITNKHGPTAREVSAFCGFDRYIGLCVGNKDTEFAKPEKALTDYVLSQLKVSNEGGCLIGDSPTDVATAINADLICYGITTGSHNSAELLEAGATATFQSLHELRKTFAFTD